MTRNDPSAADAQAARQALEAAEHAREAARSRPAAPGWYGAARGLLFAVVFGVICGPWNGEIPLLIVAGVALVAFLGVHVLVASRGGVITMPHGPVGQRILIQAIPVVAFGLGWLAALPFGQAGGAIASAVLAGAALWAVTAWAEGQGRS
ncbi:hypothetical protein FH608_031600 [Nonomuraea phyllanthi]|uniref:Uncharacterized protein n=1 Tax=Nonomuraea phyllanthi TaxID=2219224 RepID=A0A5C4VKR2_9ACTN|nr:hypothetical protein [Nonomuraea phyllanthi]KAB8191152.1 hypothetical protein FH608_031600 [Nonomuraea phyllanthi]QFY12788.1 hypothetical protein GBF35_45005 [Nonomuraea phyllanthi]